MADTQSGGTPQSIQFDAPVAPASPTSIQFDAPVASKDTSTIGPAKTPGVVSFNPRDIFAGPEGGIGGSPIGNPIHVDTTPIENYTLEGREEHPVLAKLGDVTKGVKELLFGGQAVGKAEGTSSGVVNNPVTQAMSLAPGAAEVGAGAEDIAAEKLATRAASKIKAAATRAAEMEAKGGAVIQASDGSIYSFADAKGLAEARKIDPQLKVLKPEGEINEGHFTKAAEGPTPQHGSPATTAQPLDRATVDRLPGGKNLSNEAFDALKKHVGGKPGAEIEVGSSPKNMMHRVSAPVQKTLTDTGLEMNKVIQNAPAFKTSTIADDTNTLLKDIDDIRDNLPLKLDDPANKAVDVQIQAAYPVLESTNPSEVLAYRRKLGGQIDWTNITNNPETPGEAKNLAQVKIYNALGNKLHAEIPKTVELDKVFQPNLELQTFLDKIGVNRDPVQANAEHLSELGKGKKKLAIDAHNAKVDRNWGIVKKVASIGGTGLAGALGLDYLQSR